MMAESPTARHDLRNRIAAALDPILGDEPHPREQECIDAILDVWRGLSLADLAARLRGATPGPSLDQLANLLTNAGYDSRIIPAGHVVREFDPYDDFDPELAMHVDTGPVLVVAAKEPNDG